MFFLRRFLIAIVFIIASYAGLSALHKHLDPNKHKPDEAREDARWIATSQHWLDRTACRWMGLCGLAHYHPDPAAKSWSKKRAGQEILLEHEEDVYGERIDWEEIIGGGGGPSEWDGDERVLKDVPQFVLDHAPLVHLYSKEEFWPSDISEHISHITPYLNHTKMNTSRPRHNVHNLHELNSGNQGKAMFMHSKDDVEQRPDWLGSAYNKPIPYPDEDEEEEEEVETYTEFTDEKSKEIEKEFWFDPDAFAPKQAPPLSSSFRSQSQSTRRRRISKKKSLKQKRTSPALPGPGGYSPAPAHLVLVDKGHGILDAFWFYFYSYNLGTTVLNVRFGNHVGDWEHSLIRFVDGVPKAVFFSAHSGGLAYAYNGVEKGKGKGRENRPVLYSALGSHAMYATPGKHPYVLPFGVLADVTDKGPLWDPALNYVAYHYNTSITHDQDAKSMPNSLSISQMKDVLQPASCNPKAPMGWWWYKGHWGDKFYELGDFRQWRFVGQYHYVNGPYGPRYKNLGRSKPCQSGDRCTILESIEEGKGRSWVGRRRR
ncbi:Vacuolar protein sorting-associated protein [Lachnellula occidentalis]|uniref:Vacuolar protein sorting-associated protein n=1 Tax=Lachnellula occidentalis TaxID=215460 RepID=A0A8H8S4J0_9HELO|nr:Vacuolar protein sorting-associated protein [Lachnellula occidentalis]